MGYNVTSSTRHVYTLLHYESCDIRASLSQKEFVDGFPMIRDNDISFGFLFSFSFSFGTADVGRLVLNKYRLFET
jgi:hypothetical protein